MIDPSMADSGVSSAFDSPHNHHDVDIDVDGNGNDKDDGASVTSDTEEIFAPTNPAAAYAAAYVASAAAARSPQSASSASIAPTAPMTIEQAQAQASAPVPAPVPPVQTPASPASTASAAAVAAAAAAAAVAAAAATPMARVQQYSPVAHGHLALYLAALHGSRITADNLAGSFAPPLNHEKLLEWWRVRLTTSAVFLLLRTPYETTAATTTPTTTTPVPVAPAKKVLGTDLVGVIMLRSHPAETSPHVATVDLLLVNLQYRQLGGERQLLQTVERQALREGRTLLTAEAESKSSMANMYMSLGFTEAGQIPGMVLRPTTGEKRPLSIFYKDLEQAAAAMSSRQSPAAQS
ncbi:hypothetical protein SCUCBS95973_003652 [Sporothrix curviconia]|uniref:N-acetyltransferase domain-containing protein n=1 Tax=Sporothrix curviconia TaxID=1260050 RepID=A0ABP0BH57_9PEZI